MTMKESISARIENLKAMHRIIQSCNDEGIYLDWVTWGWIPDEPDYEDFESVAEIDAHWKETCDRFGRYMEYALKEGNGGFYFDEDGQYLK